MGFVTLALPRLVVVVHASCGAWVSWRFGELCPGLPGASLFALCDDASPLSLQPFGEWCNLQPKDAAKMPESAWKLLFYTLSWSYGIYLLFFTDYPFFYDPPSVFYGTVRAREKWVWLRMSRFAGCLG